VVQRALNADGNLVVFSTSSAGFLPAPPLGAPQVFMKNLQTGALTLVSQNDAGERGNDISSMPSVSADGRFVAFLSRASNLVPNDTNVVPDVFVRDLRTGSTKRVSVDSAGVEADDYSVYPSISGNGRFVAFRSNATNLIVGDTNATDDIFVHDLATGASERVSVDSAGVEANFYSTDPAVSADGRVVAFVTIADNLVGGDTNKVEDVFVHDRSTGVTERVSVDPFGREGDQPCIIPAISGNGRIVTFTSNSDLFVPLDRNGYTDAIARFR
jgi:Tol biopolymer transport system component